MKWDYEGDFLKAWPPARRSLIVNQFCDAVRSGASEVDEVLDYVRGDARYRLRHGDEQQHESQNILLAQAGTSEAERFAKHILARERLSYSEKQKLKAEAGHDFARIYMATQPPTKKQLAYLKSLGCQSHPQTKLEASDLIERYKNAVQRSEQSASR
jgi:hypothetical protein